MSSAPASRISAIVDLDDPECAFRLSLLRRGAGEACDRFTWAFGKVQAGMGRFISTYCGDGNPLMPFSGEPRAMPIHSGGPKEIAEGFWKLLNAENRIALLARTIDPANGKVETHVINSRE